MKQVILAAVLAVSVGAAHAEGLCTDCETQYQERASKCEVGLSDEARTLCATIAQSNLDACKSDCKYSAGAQ